MKQLKISNILLWSLLITLTTLFSVGIYNRISIVKENAQKYQQTSVIKDNYKQGVLDRYPATLKLPLDSLHTTNVNVDVILQPFVNDFLIEAQKRNVGLTRLINLDFIAYDYIPPRYYEAEKKLEYLLGVHVPDKQNIDYIVINSHIVATEELLWVVVFHELTHHIRNDDYHCKQMDCSVIMIPTLTNPVAQSIIENKEYCLDILFKNIKTKQDADNNK